ncbi:hypothetical protein DRE_05258 [Drechslerella stenobrocha 248]|uniref:Zn(2)-C6 fungal-type domain-containing protein n=1 Tax=Drechslerella stenobrocha 248 TaxID=1043628 RepID=W7HZP6_9PEZI|nr:hypothetical protein DRE_05258 [Drechslerella stenobrocha 248]
MTRGVEDKNICFHCRKDKKKCVRKADEESSCERCQHYKYDCVPADSYGGIPQPVFKKQPRCTQCRKDHKVCLPYERQPGQTCNRCLEKGLPCIAAAPSGRSSRPETPGRTNFDYPSTFPSTSLLTSDASYHHHLHRAHAEHNLQRRASMHSYSPHPQSYHHLGYHPADMSARRGDAHSSASRSYRQLAPAPHPSSAPPAPGYSAGHGHFSISPSTTTGMFPPLRQGLAQTTAPGSPTPSYMSLTMSSPPTSPQSTRLNPSPNPADMTNSSERIAEIMSINNLLERPRPSSN